MLNTDDLILINEFDSIEDLRQAIPNASDRLIRKVDAFVSKYKIVKFTRKTKKGTFTYFSKRDRKTGRLTGSKRIEKV